MDTRKFGVTLRRMLPPLSALAAAAALSGCAVYAPPYAAYDTGYYSPYYYGPYAYGRPAYVGPPVALNFGYSYRSYHGGGRGWGGGRGGGGFHGGPGRGHR